MRKSSLVPIGLLLGGVLGWARLGEAQPPPPTIHRVVVQAETGVLTITGTGLGPDLLVTVDGQPVPQLPGATDTQVEALAPVTVLTTPGTFRLTMVDPMRRLGDGFVVASPMGRVVASPGRSAPAGGEPPEPPPAMTPADREAAGGVPSVATAPAPQTVIEDSVSPYRTALGYQALLNNQSSGLFNTATGHRALQNNNFGDWNTASGYSALYFNTAGSGNTATGAEALFSNTTGSDNSAQGHEALRSNSLGSSNTASGAHSLRSNTTGGSNTANGANALYSNTTGGSNTANGASALYSNTTGGGNTASGSFALSSNSTGSQNTATGETALISNSTGYSNTASGSRALRSNSTGAFNTASGKDALLSNVTGYWNTAIGVNALYHNTDASTNSATGYDALFFNTTGYANTANGSGALRYNSTGALNTASGNQALLNNTTGSWNIAFGNLAGMDATTGSYNVYLGGNVRGTAADTNTIRIGLPYDSSTGAGQNQTFIAGIHGTQLTSNAVQVFIDTNGQLGTLTPPIVTGTGTTLPQVALQQQVQEQQAINAELRTTIADLQARLVRLEAASGRRR